MIQLVCTLSNRGKWCHIPRRNKWSGPGGWIWFTLLTGIDCVHYFERKDCTELGSIVGEMLLKCHLQLPLFMSSSIVLKVIHYYRKLQTGFKWPFCRFEKHHLVVFYWPLSPSPFFQPITADLPPPSPGGGSRRNSFTQGNSFTLGKIVLHLFFEQNFKFGKFKN